MKGIDLNDPIHVFEITCFKDFNKGWGDKGIFHIITEEKYDQSFYCPICFDEAKRITSSRVEDDHEVNYLGAITVEQVLTVVSKQSEVKT